MAIIVKRFRLRHNGEVYGPGQPGGQILEGLSEEEEARLISESDGTIEKYVEPKRSKAVEKSKTEVKSKEETDGSSGAEENEEPIEVNVRPEDLIKPGKKKKEK